ncbi:sodium:calcium symporter [Methanobrevibacter sp. YE315]|uniref:sodium-dependent transporter n=1 Tax=Methanobrevibacter sp. YE315 TaxID=1609968 RepID=UPI000764D320|nr:sodium-dependent transporter [Methanobrevibacter sp. YE315]AMD17107.1 sodium:calcium symporter [Methanobrevibacter sp. YE315]
MSQRSQWDSRISFLFAMIGVAVGLGNIWRFSYVVYTNGGGTFFIPYLVAIGLLGIPFLILEYGLGFSFKKSFTEIMKSINPKFEIIAWVLVILTFIVTIYYMVILSWDLVYLISSFTFSWGTDTAAYFVNTIGGTTNLSDAATFLLPATVGVLITWFMMWFITNKDIDKGIGMASKILIPLLFIIMAIIIVYALTLPGAHIGIDALLNPKWDMLLDVNIWLAAFGQIIFSLSVGETLALTYASYLPENSRLTDNVLLVIASNSIFEICTAFGVFSILGYMTYTGGTPLVELITEGTGLMFIVFPMIFNIMGPMGHILAPLLFLAILFAGITSALGLFEPMVSSTFDKFGWSRRKTTTVLCIIGCVFSLILTIGISGYLVRIIDLFVNHFGVILLIPIQAIIFGWIYGLDNVIPVLNEHSTIKVGRLWKLIIKFIAPVVLFTLWIFGVVELFSNANSFEIILYTAITIIVLVSAVLLSRKKSAEN